MLLKLTDIGGDACLANSEEIIYATTDTDCTIIEFKDRGYLRVTDTIEEIASMLGMDQ